MHFKFRPKLVSGTVSFPKRAFHISRVESQDALYHLKLAEIKIWYLKTFIFVADVLLKNYFICKGSTLRKEQHTVSN